MYSDKVSSVRPMPLMAMSLGECFEICDIQVNPRFAQRLLWLGIYEGENWTLSGRDSGGNVVLSKDRHRVSLQAAWIKGIQVLRTTRPVVVDNSAQSSRPFLERLLT